MEMIIGGSYQGKEAYARAQFPDIHWICGVEASFEELCGAEGVLGLEQFIQKELKEGRDVSGLGEALWEKNPDVVLTVQEVGCGVVPIDAFERKYREAVGRICTVLASHSKKVTRVVCGIGTVIKDD